MALGGGQAGEAELGQGCHAHDEGPRVCGKHHAGAVEADEYPSKSGTDDHAGASRQAQQSVRLLESLGWHGHRDQPGGRWLKECLSCPVNSGEGDEVPQACSTTEQEHCERHLSGTAHDIRAEHDLLAPGRARRSV